MWLLRDSETFRKQELLEGREFLGDVPLKGILGPRPVFSFSVPQIS